VTRILVTGASGFIGRTLVTELAGAGHSVRAAMREPADIFPRAVEVVAASLRASAEPVEGRPADVLVVAGTLTDTMAPAIARLYAELPEPKHVISFGACADCGGPYWDSYCVTKGVDQLIPVDVYVPGCPPRPEALLDGLQTLASRIDAGVLAG